MLRLFETRTGQVVGVRPGPLRLYVHQPDDLRVCLVADLLRRTAGRLRRQVVATAAHDADHRGLNIGSVDAGPPVPGAIGVGNVTSDPSTTAVTVASWDAPGAAPPAEPPADPLALRLALLEVHYREHALIGPQVLTAAETRLAGWRTRVALWGTHRSYPIARHYADEALDRLGDDLDVPAVLGLLDRLAEDPLLEEGARYETAVHLDLVLGLDLVRYLGRL